MVLARYILLSLPLLLVGCDEIPHEHETEKKDLVTPEEKKALEKFGGRLPEG